MCNPVKIQCNVLGVPFSDSIAVYFPLDGDLSLLHILKLEAFQTGSRTSLRLL